ncbi:MAG: hypothetical protein QOK72_10475, partial [Nitrososphaeraceae archaeon]|nr:hypothetical protein [Nitrososphaeraceae archaeon]
CLTFLYSDVYGLSPQLKTEFLSKEIQNYIYYGLTDDDSNKTLNYLQQSSDLDRVYISSNGTHLEIKFLFNDFLNKLKNTLLNSSTVPQNLFINIFIDSDDDETTGFLGYNYRYLLAHNISNSYNDTKLNSPTITTNFSRFTQNQSNHTEILDGEELQEIITRTINSKDLIEKLNWNIRGYELLDYDFQPLFFSSKLTKKYLSVIPNGFKVTLDLAQIGYPTNYAVLVEVGRKSEDYKFSHVFGKIHVPHPDLNLEVKSIDINNGKNSVVLEFNNTGLYKLNVKAELLKKDLSDDNLSINFTQGNHFTLLGGKGVIPMDIIANSNYHQKNIVVPLNLSYSVIGENDFIESSFNNSLTNENIYNKILYLNLNLINERNRLINFDEIPSEYIAIFLGAVFSFFIPSITRSTKEYFQKRNANKYLKNILKEQNLSDNPDISIKNVMSILRILKYEYIRGRISKDQYDILKENIGDVIKDLMSKSEFRG